MPASLLIPAALCFTFGNMVHDRRQGLAVLAAKLVIFVPLAYAAEQAGNPFLGPAVVDLGNAAERHDRSRSPLPDEC
jgi:potassium-transporting ATPase potassium-binding subunit